MSRSTKYGMLPFSGSYVIVWFQKYGMALPLIRIMRDDVAYSEPVVKKRVKMPPMTSRVVSHTWSSLNVVFVEVGERNATSMMNKRNCTLDENI